MKKLFILTLISFIIFLSGLGLSIWFLAGMDQMILQSKGESTLNQESIPYIALIIPAEQNYFMDDYSAYLKKQGLTEGLEISQIRYSLAGTDIQEQFEKLIYSRVQGIICLPPQEPDLTPLINSAVQRGIPVILIKNDLPLSKRQVFIGSSPYQMGQETSRILSFYHINNLKAGVLLPQEQGVDQTAQSRLFISGLRQNQTDLKVIEKISPPGRFTGEELVWQLLYTEKNLNLLITTEPKDTLSAIQTIVEANKVGKVYLVGQGEGPEFNKALQDGILKGLILRSPKEWGRKSLDVMKALLANKPVNSFEILPLYGRIPLDGGKNVP